MSTARRRGFTLIELLMVVVVIAILVAVALPVLFKILSDAEIVQCQGRLKNVGTWFIAEAVVPRNRAYPAGHPTQRTSPGRWPTIHSELISSLKTEEITRCPSVKPESPLSSDVWSTCSYAYVGNMNLMYSCTCSECGSDGKDVWRLYWSGVDYTGDHGDADAGGNLNKLKGLPLADNLVFLRGSVDGDEPTSPTIPDHQDTAVFTSDDRPVKFRDQRALRAIPMTPADHNRSVPLVLDILVYRTTGTTGFPTSSATSWKASDLDITETNKYDVLYANHCNTSATNKRDWGINIFYSNGQVKWKGWDDLRFQVTVKKVVEDANKYHSYFY